MLFINLGAVSSSSPVAMDATATRRTVAHYAKKLAKIGSLIILTVLVEDKALI